MEPAHIWQRPFNPAPYQKPRPPIWIGGDSERTLELVKELADGWVMLRSGNPETLRKVLSAPDWPKRPMTLVKNARLFVAEDRQQALDEAGAAFRKLGGEGTLNEFIQREIVGTREECLERIAEIGSWGINYLRLQFDTSEQQERAARLILPRVS